MIAETTRSVMSAVTVFSNKIVYPQLTLVKVA
jgi:hypothetical protein